MVRTGGSAEALTSATPRTSLEAWLAPRSDLSSSALPRSAVFPCMAVAAAVGACTRARACSKCHAVMVHARTVLLSELHLD